MGSSPSEREGTAPPRLDTSVAHSARVWNYLLGGKDNLEADREAGNLVSEVFPGMVTMTRQSRQMLVRVVRYLAGEAGIRQFLDIGTGLPSGNNTHEVAQRAAPDSRIVYVDSDPIVLNHAQALLTSTPQGACAYIDADLRDTAKILKDAASVLDFGRPVAVGLIMVMQFIPDDDDPWRIARTLMDSVPSGSYLAVAHPASDVDQEVGPALRQLSTRMGGTRAVPRSHHQVSRFFDGLEMVEPGLVQLHRWRPGPGVDGTRDLAAYGGVGRKP